MINLLSSELVQPFLLNYIGGVILAIFIWYVNEMRKRDTNELREKIKESNINNKEYFEKIDQKQEKTYQQILDLKNSLMNDLTDQLTKALQNQNEKNDLKYQKKQHHI